MPVVCRRALLSKNIGINHDAHEYVHYYIHSEKIYTLALILREEGGALWEWNACSMTRAELTEHTNAIAAVIPIVYFMDQQVIA